MSTLVWSCFVSPPDDAVAVSLQDEWFGDSVAETLAIPLANTEIEIPDPRAFRSMSRAALFLSHVCMKGRDAMAPFLSRSPHSIGVYCAVENGPIDAHSTAKILEAREHMGFADAYRKIRNPKTYLKQLPNLAPAQMGISLGLRGPLCVYTHSRFGALQALEQAEWHLQADVVDAALVCASHAFDDYLVVKRTASDDERPLAEGAAAILLVKSDSMRDWSPSAKGSPNRWYGIAEAIVNTARESLSK